MRTNKILTTSLVLVLESFLLAQAHDGGLGDTTGSVIFSSNETTGRYNESFPVIIAGRQSDSPGIPSYRSTDHSAIMKSPSRNNEQLSLGDSGVFEVDLSTAEGMEHMHIMKKKPKYKKVKMEVLEPKIKYKKIKMKYKKPVKKMKKKKVKGYVKAEKMKMKKMKHYGHYD